MGKERISSQEIADYTNINATQIRRDLSNFGKFGKRGVGYSIDSLLGEIRKILRTQGQHNIALVGAGRLGQAIASSPIFAEHGITIAAVFDTDEAKIGTQLGNATIEDERGVKDAVREKNIVVGVLAVPASCRAERRDRSGRRRRADHLQLLGSTSRRTGGRHRPHVEPGRGASPRPLLPFDLELPGCACCSGTGTSSAARGRTSTRAPSRSNGRARGTRSWSSARSGRPSTSTSAARRLSSPICPAGCCPSSCSTATPVSSRACCRISPRPSGAPTSMRTQRCSASCSRPTWSSPITC